MSLHFNTGGFGIKKVTKVRKLSTKNIYVSASTSTIYSHKAALNI